MPHLLWDPSTFYMAAFTLGFCQWIGGVSNATDSFSVGPRLEKDYGIFRFYSGDLFLEATRHVALMHACNYVHIAMLCAQDMIAATEVSSLLAVVTCSVYYRVVSISFSISYIFPSFHLIFHLSI